MRLKAALIKTILMISGPVFAAKTDYVAPAFFFENFGGVDSGSRFIMESPGFKAIFRNDGVVYRSGAVETTLRFSGADPHVVIEPIERISGTVNFLIGADASHWKTGVPVYRGLRYRSLYRGIDVVYHVADDRVKADFVVAPGADAGQIRLQYPNARLRIERNGDLVVAGASDLRENAPFIYQETRAGIVAIEGRYRLEDEHTATFEIGEYDASLPLIIDPVITYATFCGGSTIGSVAGVAADTSGNVYVAGWTEALNFPISGAIQASNRGGVDAFVAKLNPAGTALVYATYIGGNGDDRAAAIAVDGSGQAYITGSTSSTNFPLTAQIRSTLGGGRDGFAVKLNAAGSAYVYSTYLGGSAWDQGTSIAVDSTGAAYIAGDTQSSDFPVLSAVQSALGGQIDAFVTKLGASGAISFSTFLGGSSNEHAGGIAIDSSRNVYIAGGTYSSNFPVANAFQRTLAGGQDAFVAKIASTGSSIAYSTYLGGSGGGQSMPEQVNAIAVDGSGAAYVAGVTGSVNFPTTSGVLRTTGTGFGDAFVAKLSSAGNALSYSTYLGGTTSNAVTGIAVDSSGNAYAVGFTSSVDFPQTGALQTFGGAYDAFIAELNPGATALVYSTYYGGSGSDIANAIAIDADSSLYVAGQTSSADFPVVSGYQNAYPGMATGWVLRVAGTAAALPATPTLASPGNGASGVSSAPALSWSAATGATSYDIYLGTSTSPAYVANVSGTTYGASGLGSGQTYYWQVAARNSSGTKASAIWSFQTAAAGGGGAPSMPSLTTPANGLTGVSSPTLTWSAATGATSYDLYFGTSSSPGYLTNLSGTSYAPTGLTAGQTYYWTVAAKNSAGTTISATWWFRTAIANVPSAVFRDTSGSIRLANYPSSTLSNSGGSFASDPSSAEDMSGNTWVAARDGSNSIRANVYNAGAGTWSGWAGGGGTIQGVPAIAVDTSGMGWIASRDNSNSYWLVSYKPGSGFGTWTPLSGAFSTDPVMTACGDGSFYLLGKDNYNSLWSAHYIPGSGLQGWIFGGGVVKGKPSAACGTDNAMYIAIEDFYNSNWVARVSGNTWTGWYFGGAITSVVPRITSLGNGSLALVILDATNVVWKATFTQGTGNGWQNWVQVGGILQDMAAAGGSGNLYLAGKTSAGDLWWWQQSSNQWTSIGNRGIAAGAISAALR